MSNKSIYYDQKSSLTVKESVVLTFWCGPGYIACRKMACRKMNEDVAYARITESGCKSVDFCGGRKTGEPGEKPSEQGWEPTTNSTHIWPRVRESNPGHIGGRRALSPLRQPCSQIQYTVPKLYDLIVISAFTFTKIPQYIAMIWFHVE